MHLGPHHDHPADPHHGHPLLASGADGRLHRAFALAVILNTLLVIGEAIGGLLSGSMALLADAGHNLGDIAGLLLAWGAHWLRQRGRSNRWTYGWRSFTILAANMNGVLLVVAIIGVGLESLRRLWQPTEVAETAVVFIALGAAVLNFATAKLLASPSHGDLNVRGAYLHMLADAAVSLAVVGGAVAMLLSGWLWIDPAVSLAICLVLAFGTWGLLRESLTMLLHAAPRKTDVDEVRTALLNQPNVLAVLDLHIWSISTTEAIMTARLLSPPLPPSDHDELVARLHQQMKADFDISHATFEISHGGGTDPSCPLDSGLIRNILT